VLEHKSGNISETRKDRGKLLWRAYRNSQTLFRTVPSPNPYGLLFPKIGVRNPKPKLWSLLFQEWARLRTLNLVRPNTVRDPSEWKPIRTFWRKGSVGVSRDCPIFGGTLLSQEWVKLRTSNMYAHLQDRSKQKPIKNFGKGSRGRILRDSQDFSGFSYIGRIAWSSLR